mmetsp:Transcript_71144/g.231065  ORF Transcript_71144/g.231065 Transcript_71144/m.231065 type:complete len:122 (+) Transcript_71144:230-595(+)
MQPGTCWRHRWTFGRCTTTNVDRWHSEENDEVFSVCEVDQKLFDEAESLRRSMTRPARENGKVAHQIIDEALRPSEELTQRFCQRYTCAVDDVEGSLCSAWCGCGFVQMMCSHAEAPGLSA